MGEAGRFRGAIIPVVAIATMAIAAVCGGKATTPWPKKPNIIFILADDLGYGDLGCYGQTRIRTPNLDRMAAEGVRYTDFYAGSTVCAPSRCCLMTGLHTGHARIRGNKRVPLRPEDLTVAEVLKTAGYSTALIGKWGLGEAGSTGVPNRQGFDEFFGYLNQTRAHNYYPEWLWRNEQKENLTSGTYSNDLFTSLALDYVRTHTDKPFFLYLSYTIPHANNELAKKTGNGMEVPSDAPYSNEKWPQVEKNFAAMITRLDGDVGRIMALLKELGIDNKTVVFFSSDNGPHKEGGQDPDFFSSGGPLRGIKRDLYDGGIRVPTIIRFPGVVAAGKTDDTPFAFWDFLPTAAVLAGVKVPQGIDGIPILQAPGVTQAPPHKYLYWEFFERGFQQAVHTGKWKAVRLKQGDPPELYNIVSDPGEKTNIASEHPDVVRECETIMREARTDSPDFPVTAGDNRKAKPKARARAKRNRQQ